MASSKKAADDVQVAIADARKTIQAATQVMQEATNGKGLLPTLLTNQELARDLQALVSNLRDHGVLFYRDSAAKAEAQRRSGAAPGHAAKARGTLMTPLLTVNLLRALFLTFCAAIGGIVTAETQENAIPGILIGTVFALSSCWRIDC